MRLPFTHPLHLALGLIIWGIWFVGVYGGLSLGCMAASDPQALDPFSWINISLLLFTVVTAALLSALAFRCWRYPVPKEEQRKQQRFTLRVAAAVYLSSAVATLAVGLPVIVVPPCV